MPDDDLGRRGALSPLGINAVAAGWGFAEATLFFLVPDVFTTWIALRDPRAGFAACFWALGGALVGGAVMFAWGAADLAAAVSLLERIPAIDRPMCDRVSHEIQSSGIVALVLGPLRGTPYKIYAVFAGAHHLNLLLFLTVSLLARLARFLAVTALAASASPYLSLRVRRLAHICFWTAFYTWFFSR